MKKQNMAGNRKLLASLLLPYLIFNLVILGIFSAFFFRSYRMMETEELQLGEERLAAVENRISAEILNNLSVFSLLENNYQAEQFSRTSEENTAELPIRSFYFQKEIIRTQASANINYMAAYFPEKGYVISSDNGYNTSTLDLFLSGHSIDRELLEELMHRKYSFRFLGPRKCWLTSRADLSDGNRMLLIADFSLEKIFRDELGKDAIYAIGDGESILYVSDERLRPVDYQDLFVSSDRQLGTGSEKMLAVRKDLDYQLLRLMIAVPRSAFFRQLTNLGRFGAVVFAAELVITCLAAVYLARRFYRPLRELKGLLKRDDPSMTAANVLTSAGEHIQEIAQSNKNLREEASLAVPVLAGNMLNHLAQAEGEEAAVLSREVLEKTGVGAESEYVLICIGVQEPDDLKEKAGVSEDTVETERQEDAGASADAAAGETGTSSEYPAAELQEAASGRLYSFLSGQLNRELFNDTRGLLADMDGYYLIFAGDHPDRSRLQAVTDRLREMCRQQMDIRLIVTEPVRGRGAASLKENFLSARTKITHSLFWSMEYQHETLPEKSYNSYIEIIKKLVNCLNGHQYDEAERLLDEIVTYHIPRDEVNIRKAIYRMYGTIGIVIAVIESQTGAHWENAGQLDYNSRLYRVRQISEFKKEARSILSELIAYEQQYRNNSMPQIISSAKEYIDEHFRDSGLNVAAVAAAQGISDSYLTRMFRSYMDCNVLEYIQRKRVEEAKELLKTESIKNTAQMVGLWDTQALIRLFKKYEGVTPGAYKEGLTT